MLRALISFAAPGGRFVNAGDIVNRLDPVVKGREALFEPVTDAVEQATAAPGEKRTVTRARKAPAKKATD